MEFDGRAPRSSTAAEIDTILDNLTINCADTGSVLPPTKNQTKPTAWRSRSRNFDRYISYVEGNPIEAIDSGICRRSHTRADQEGTCRLEECLS